jgi:general secretion pathway protein I
MRELGNQRAVHLLMKNVCRQPVSRSRMRGFSLIEMIAAFLVFAIAIGVLMSVLASSIRNTRQSSDYTMAALWAQSKLDGVGVGEPVEAGHSSGRFDDNYGWDLDIKQVDPSEVEPPPQQAVAGRNAQGQTQGQRQSGTVSAQNAGNGGAIDISPFDIYEVDLVVSWGGRFGAQPRTAHFGTLRAVNPDPNRAQGGIGMPPPLRTRGGKG